MPDASSADASPVDASPADASMPEAASPETVRWGQVLDLLDAALDRPPEARAAFLAQAAPDADVRAEVEALLVADAQAPAFLDGDAGAYATPLLTEGVLGGALDEWGAPDALAGLRLGPYVLHHRIGRGGMGAVYLGERADGTFNQRVAVKLLRTPPHPEAAERLAARFRTERQILASLDHPGLARLLDGGVTEPSAGGDGLPAHAGGTPYLVMEYVDGEALTAYCDRHRLGVEARLRLFCQVADAVQAAHRRLVVHRDLKPSNVLVTDDDAGRPQVKLLDFGIAKILADEALRSDGTRAGTPAPGGLGHATVVQTQTGEHWMTPAYAAPEQVRGEPVTTTTDVYQLGVVLYELLTGRRPFDGEEGSSGTPYEVARAVLEHDPTRPSSVFLGPSSTASFDAEAAGAARSTDPRRLSRRLAGDLDVIVLKALRKEPERRYPSAVAFADDVRRHLDGLPVEARPDTVMYRVQKFVRRHRALAGAALAILMLLVGYAVTVTVQSREVRAALVQAEAERAKAEAVSGFLMDLFEANTPAEARGDALSARDLLVRGQARADALAAQPETQAQMLEVIGETYYRLGLYDEAEASARRALALRDSLFDGPHPDRVSSLLGLGLVLNVQSRLDEADSLLTRAQAMQQALARKARGEAAAAAPLLRVQMALAQLRREQGRYDESVRLYRAVVDRLGPARDDVPGSGSSGSGSSGSGSSGSGSSGSAEAPPLLPDERVDAYDGLGMALYERGDLDAAAEAYRNAVALGRRHLGAEHPDVASSLANLAYLSYEQGDPAGAIDLFERVLAIEQRLYDADHPELVTTMNNLAVLYFNLERYDEAEPMLREVIASSRRTLGPDHPETAASMHNLASLLNDTGRRPEAIRTMREVIRINVQALGARHPQVADARLILADFLRRQGRATDDADVLAAARREADQALTVSRAALGDEHAQVGRALRMRGLLDMDLGRLAAAEADLRQSVRVFEAAYDVDHWRTSVAYYYLGRCQQRRGRYAEAEASLVTAYERAQRPSDTRDARDALAALYDAWGRPNAAARYR